MTLFDFDPYQCPIKMIFFTLKILNNTLDKSDLDHLILIGSSMASFL